MRVGLLRVKYKRLGFSLWGKLGEMQVEHAAADVFLAHIWQFVTSEV